MRSTQPVVLFYRDFERDSLFRNDRYLKRVLKPIYHRIYRGQKTTGFRVWFELLVHALRQQGEDVLVNDFRFARRNPDYPVGLCGYPSILDGWSLPNPAILGPGLYDHPAVNPGLMRDPRYRRYIITCDWMMDLFKPVYGDACFMWHAGIDTDRWPDVGDASKSVDFLIYDKTRWNREQVDATLVQPILAEFNRRGLSFETLRYTQYDYPMYRDALKRSRYMLFLCEHETQGMAYQEAMSSNVPILAWDPGFWHDPQRERYTSNPVPTCSVPYFSEACGRTFRSADDFVAALDSFLSDAHRMSPRRYVMEALSFDRSARLYMEQYRALKCEAERGPAVSTGG